MKVEKNVMYKNPFPVTAVASFNNDMQNDMIVETAAIKELKEIVDKWILNENDGITVAVQGEYGTGKTQLAIEMQRYIRKIDDKKYHFICLESPSGSFLEMYKNRFLIEITKEQVLERLEECYCEIILNNIKQDEIYRKVLQEKGNIKSIEFIEQFGLAKSKYDSLFAEQMQNATKNVKFVPALLLLLEARFEREVWAWFGGAEPSEAMQERGVRCSISDDAMALEALGVFAFLFGQRGHYFILFIDEMEKIVSSTDKTKGNSFKALKKLLETVKATKSMLILCGLPDFYITLPKDTQQRIAYQIRTDGITLSEIEEYIYNANEKVNDVKNIIPFNNANLEEMLDISNGNIRTIIRLLYHAGNWYIENRSEIDEKALHDILDNAYGTFNLSGAKRRLEQIFVSKGWMYEEKKSVKSDLNVLIDFWLPSALTKKGKVENGIEIYLVQNVLSEDTFKQIKERISGNANNCKICVVEGFINECFNKGLLEVATHVIRYRMSEFSEFFISVIEGEKAKLENNIKKNEFGIINEKIEQLSRIVNNAVNEMNEKYINRQEFYYLLRKLSNVQEEGIYSLPEKESEFYLLIFEIQKIIDIFEKGRNERYEMGVLYLFREFSYILYYIIEKPQKLQIPIGIADIHEVYKNVDMLVERFSRNCSFLFNKAVDKYNFILKYLSRGCDEKEKVVYVSKENENDMFLLDMVYDEDFFSASNMMKRVSQNFCAELLIGKSRIIEKYERIFVSVYSLMYEIEPSIVSGEKVEFDMEILREYYDVLRRYFKGNRMYDSGKYLGILFENYENGLRRIVFGHEF